MPRLLRLPSQGRSPRAAVLVLVGVVAPEGGGEPGGRRHLSGEGLAQAVPLHERSLRPALRPAQGVVRLRGIVETWGIEDCRLDGGSLGERCRGL